MKPIKNLVAFVTGASKAGFVFAKAMHEGKELEIVITKSVAGRAPSEMEIDNRIVVDVMPSTSEKYGLQLLVVTIHSVQPAAEYKGPARVKWFHLDKMFGGVIIEHIDGPVEAFIPKTVVDAMGWLPGQGTMLEVEAYEAAKGWVVDSFILVEKKRDAA
jgi:hypothetical protein